MSQLLKSGSSRVYFRDWEARLGALCVSRFSHYQEKAAIENTLNAIQPSSFTIVHLQQYVLAVWKAGVG